jgi:hypothetical protein
MEDLKKCCICGINVALGEYIIIKTRIYCKTCAKAVIKKDNK